MILVTFFHALCSATYTEEKNSGIGFDNSSVVRDTTMERAAIRSNGIEMRGSAEGGSILTFNNTNPNDEWSFEFTINNMNLNFPQSAGIYLWYTNSPIKQGDHKGAHGKFVGMMAGIEFLGRYVQLVLTSNDGKQDHTGIDDVTIMRDSVNPERFRNMSEFRIKVISTEKNFKMEIYDKDKLIYDNLRFLHAAELGDRGAGKHFSFTTTYEKVPLDKHIMLENAILYKRVEHSDYDPLEILAEYPVAKARMPAEIDHSNKEMQFLISNMEHFMSFIKALLGKPAGTNIMQGLMDTRRESIKHNVLMTDIQKDITVMQRHTSTSSLKELSSKVKSLEKRANAIQHSTREFMEILKEMETNYNNRSRGIMLLMVVGMVALVAINLYKSLAPKKVPGKKK